MAERAAECLTPATSPPPEDGSSRAKAFFERFLGRTALVAMALALATAVLGFFAAKVRTDFSVEFLFPERSQAKTDYDRYKRIYPYEDARALVMVEAPDLWTPAGLERLARLEADLAGIEGANDVEGPLSVKDVIDAGGETVKLEKLIPRPDLPPGEIERRRATATGDPLFRWRLSPPDGSSVTITVILDKHVAAKDELRNRFLADLRRVVARHEEGGQKITISGLPVIRSEYTEMISGDQRTTFPLALVVILILLYAIFRSPKEVLAALLTIAASIVWTRGAMGILGYPEQILTAVVPTVVMIVSISDTVHIVIHHKDALARGAGGREALLEAMADSAWPCLLTEVTIAAGFFSLYFVNIVLISQFGIATACGMILTWAANMTVLPLALYWLKPAPAILRAAGGRGGAERAFERFFGFIERQVTRRPGRVMAAALVILAGGALAASRMGMEYYAFDDLRPGSPIKKEIEYAERTYGGCDPLVVFIEPAEGAPANGPMLEPEAVKLMDRVAATIKALFPAEAKNVLSAAEYVKKAHRIFAGAEVAAEDPYPATRRLVAQELEFVDDGKILRDYLDFERRTAAVYVPMPDVGTSRLSEIMDVLEPHLKDEERAVAERGLPVRLTLTGMFTIGDDIYRTLVGGLLSSLAGAVAVSFVVFCVVLRSWRLGILALIPNILPLVLTFGFMGIASIDLTPTTVIVFSITLVIADDDTVQYFARFRSRFFKVQAAGAENPHAAAAIRTLHEVGLPMFVTSCAVSLGFLTLLFSEFEGLADFGILVGVSLFTAIFADLFLTPILLSRLRPRLGPAVKAPASATATAPPARAPTS